MIEDRREIRRVSTLGVTRSSRYRFLPRVDIYIFFTFYASYLSRESGNDA